MKRLIFSLFCFLLLCATASSEPVQVRIKTLSKQTLRGTLIGRTTGALDFQPAGSPTILQIPDVQIATIQFSLPTQDTDRIKMLFDAGEYSQAAEQFNTLLSPFLPYVNFLSDLTPQFMFWMIASYWAGDYDRVQMLSVELERFGLEGLQNTARFYRGLAELAEGDAQTLEAFLKTPEADTIYPPDSAARLYIEAGLLLQQQRYVPAIRTAARLMALHSRDADWMPQAELLCAEIYFKLDMTESAQAVLTDINDFYSDPQIQKKAAKIAERN